MAEAARPCGAAGVTDAPAAIAGAGPRRRLDLRALTWAFTAFNAARTVAYPPNIWSIHAEAESSRHSLATWLILLGANATMTAWLYEQHHGQRIGKGAAVSIGNAPMCLATVASIGRYRS